MAKKMQCKVFVGGDPIIIIDNEEVYHIEAMVKGEKLKKDIGYVVGDYVYVYRGKLKDKNPIKPGIYKKGDQYITIEPNEHDKEKYHVSEIIELDPAPIFNIIEKNKEGFIDPEDIEIFNNNSEVYTPTIKASDDFLKYIIKRAIIDKRINLRNYKGRFNNEYALNNMKSGLNKSTKMTVPNFVKWVEVLGLNWKLEVWDSGEDTINPLPKPISISNKDL